MWNKDDDYMSELGDIVLSSFGGGIKKNWIIIKNIYLIERNYQNALIIYGAIGK